jgi:hypothetical protein
MRRYKHYSEQDKTESRPSPAQAERRRTQQGLLHELASVHSDPFRDI